MRFATLSGYPWRGLSPLRLAAATGALSARLTDALGQEAAVAVARVIPMPQGQSAAVSNAIRNLITQPRERADCFARDYESWRRCRDGLGAHAGLSRRPLGI